MFRWVVSSTPRPLYSAEVSRNPLNKGFLMFIIPFYLSRNIFYNVGPVAQSIYRLATGWAIRDRIPVGTRSSARPNRPWGPPSLLYNGYRVFPGGKVRPGRAADHSPPSSAAVLEQQSYTSLYPPSGPHWACNGITLLLHFIFYNTSSIKYWLRVYVTEMNF